MRVLRFSDSGVQDLGLRSLGYAKLPFCIPILCGGFSVCRVLGFCFGYLVLSILTRRMHRGFQGFQGLDGLGFRVVRGLRGNES